MLRLRLRFRDSLIFALASTFISFVVHADEVYVTNQKSDSVSIINTNTRKVLETTNIDGWFPHNIVFSPDGREAWIANLGSANVSILDTSTRKIKMTLPPGGLCGGDIHHRRPWSEPQGIREDCSRVHEVAIRPDGKFAYITNLDSDYIWVFDTATKKETGRIKSGSSARMVFSSDGKTGYVVSSHSLSIPVLDTIENIITHELPVGKGVFGLAISPDNSLLYITTGKDNHLIILDIAGKKKLAEIMVGNDPHTVVISADGNRAYVTNRDDNEIAIIDTVKREIIRKIKSGREPDLAALSGQYLYVTNKKDNTLSIINTVSLELETTIRVGREPHGIAVKP